MIATTLSFSLDFNNDRMGKECVATHLGEKDVFFMDIFLEESASELLLGPIPPDEKKKGSKPPKGLPAYLAHLWKVPLLSAEQEYHAFRKLNYLKYRSACLEASLRSCVGCVAMLDDLERLGNQQVEVRNLIIESNLRLVYSLAKRYARLNSQEFDEAICVGNACLVRAVDLFDFRRGLRFSTYAYQAIQTAIFGAYRKEGKVRSKFSASGGEAVESAVGDAGASDLAGLHCVELREQVIQLMEALDERDRIIVMARFGIDQRHSGVAFHVIAKEVGLSTTRTVQLFHRSIAKMRSLIAKRRLVLQ